MADDPPVSPSPSPSPVVSPPIEEWVVYTFSSRFSPGYTPSWMNQVIEQASSADGRWNYQSVPNSNEKWIMCQAPAEVILNGIVLDFREAYGAAFEDAAKDDKTLIPASCLSYVDASFFYNLAIYFGLYYLGGDGVTKKYVADYFYQGWKEASIYRRAIAISRRRYREEIASGVSAEGTPVYISRTERRGRSL